MIYLFLFFFLLLSIFLARYNFFRLPKKGILVLLYHRIDDKPTGTSLDKFSIPLKIFEKHIKILRKKGFLSVNPENIEHIVEKKLYLKHRYVLFTFDDGYKDNLCAAEILKKYGYSGIFFISTAYIGSKLNGVEMLNINDLKKLVNMGMFLGSHSHEHLKLAELKECEIKTQVEKSLTILSGFQKIEDFAYPFGSYSEKVQNIIRTSGIKRAYIIGQQIYQPGKHSKFKIPRAIIRKSLDDIDFYLIITRGRSRF